jgi:hypothetical protein
MSIPGAKRFRQAFLTANERPGRLAFILSRYRFGEACGPDLIARIVPSIRDLRLKRICLRQACDEATHCALLTRRIEQMGHDPEAYQPSEINQRILGTELVTDDPLEFYAKLQAYEAHFAGLCALHHACVADPPTKRVLGKILTDEHRHLRMCEAVIDGLADTPSKRRAAEELRRRIDALVTEREAQKYSVVFASDDP